jgi:uncharacterized protein (DUF1778 family)
MEKDVRLYLRVSEKDKVLLKQKAKNAELNLSSYILQRCFLGKDFISKDRKEIKELFFNLKSQSGIN